MLFTLPASFIHAPTQFLFYFPSQSPKKRGRNLERKKPSSPLHYIVIARIYNLKNKNKQQQQKQQQSSTGDYFSNTYIYIIYSRCHYQPLYVCLSVILTHHALPSVPLSDAPPPPPPTSPSSLLRPPICL